MLVSEVLFALDPHLIEILLDQLGVVRSLLLFFCPSESALLRRVLAPWPAVAVLAGQRDIFLPALLTRANFDREWLLHDRLQLFDSSSRIASISKTQVEESCIVRHSRHEGPFRPVLW